HHFRDKESLFLAVAEDDAAAMVTTVARNGLVQVMRDLLERAAPAPRTAATRERPPRQRDAGVLRSDVDLAVLAQFLELAYDGLVLHLAMGRPNSDLARGSNLVGGAG